MLEEYLERAKEHKREIDSRWSERNREHKRELGRKWRERNRDKLREYNRLYSRKRRQDPQRLEYFNNYRRSEENRLRINSQSKQRRHSARQYLIGEMGGCCIRCGFSDWRALQIDHVQGGGIQERKLLSNPGVYYKQILESFYNSENKYQLLCANCNQIKRYENEEYHKPKE